MMMHGPWKFDSCFEVDEFFFLSFAFSMTSVRYSVFKVREWKLETIATSSMHLVEFLHIS